MIVKFDHTFEMMTLVDCILTTLISFNFLFLLYLNLSWLQCNVSHFSRNQYNDRYLLMNNWLKYNLNITFYVNIF